MLTSQFCLCGAVGQDRPPVPLLDDFLDFADIMPLIRWPQGQNRERVIVEPPLPLLPEAQPLLVGAVVELPVVLHRPVLAPPHHQGHLGVGAPKKPAHGQQAVPPPLLGDVAEESGVVPLQVVSHGPRGHGHVEGPTDVCGEKGRRTVRKALASTGAQRPSLGAGAVGVRLPTLPAPSASGGRAPFGSLCGSPCMFHFI